MQYDEEMFPMYYITPDIVAPVKGYDYLNDNYYSDYIDKENVKQLAMTGDEPDDRLKDILKYKNIEILYLHPNNCSKVIKYIKHFKNLKRLDASYCRLDKEFLSLFNLKNIEYFFINSKINGLRGNALYLDSDLNDRIISINTLVGYKYGYFEYNMENIGKITVKNTVINDTTKPKILIQDSYLYNYGSNIVNSVIIRLDHLEEDVNKYFPNSGIDIKNFILRWKDEIHLAYKGSGSDNVNKVFDHYYIRDIEERR